VDLDDWLHAGMAVAHPSTNPARSQRPPVIPNTSLLPVLKLWKK